MKKKELLAALGEFFDTIGYAIWKDEVNSISAFGMKTISDYQLGTANFAKLCKQYRKAKRDADSKKTDS